MRVEWCCRQPSPQDLSNKLWLDGRGSRLLLIAGYDEPVTMGLPLVDDLNLVCLFVAKQEEGMSQLLYLNSTNATSVKAADCPSANDNQQSFNMADGPVAAMPCVMQLKRSEMFTHV